MQTGLYVNVGGLNAIERRLNTIATNVANMNTAGYRAEEVSFQALVARKDGSPVSYVTAGTDYVSRQTGPLSKTGNPLDVAVTGNGWLALQGPNGTIYTRDGRMRMQANGALQSVNGYPVLDAGNSGILLDPDGGAPTIAKDGMITQGGRQVGAIGLFTLDDGAKLQRVDNSGVVSNKAATPRPRLRRQRDGTGLRRRREHQPGAGNGEAHFRATRVRKPDDRDRQFRIVPEGRHQNSRRYLLKPFR